LQILQSAEYEESMKKFRNHKLICMLLTIVIMISGICLGEIQASSSFSCKQESSIKAANSVVLKESVYRTEQLSQKEVISSIRQVRNITRRIHSRSEYETELCLFDVEVLPQKSLYLTAAEEGAYLEHSCSIAILNYIHKQDGEKA